MHHQTTDLTIINEQTLLEGKVIFTSISRVHGTLKGAVYGAEGSVLILAESSVTEGNIHAETLYVNGYVRGDIYATKKVTLSSTARVVGNIHTHCLKVEFGACFDGSCAMLEGNST